MNSPDEILEVINKQCKDLVDDKKSPYAVRIGHKILLKLCQSPTQPNGVTVVPETRIMGLPVIENESLKIEVIDYEKYLILRNAPSDATDYDTSWPAITYFKVTESAWYFWHIQKWIKLFNHNVLDIKLKPLN